MKKQTSEDRTEEQHLLSTYAVYDDRTFYNRIFFLTFAPV